MDDAALTPFRVLSDEEFANLTTDQRVGYLENAIEALDTICAQMATELGMHPPSGEVSKVGSSRP